MKKFFTQSWSLLKETYRSWNEREPFNNSIIIAYYAIFSLPGLLIVLITIAGYFFGKEAVTGQLTGQIQGMVGGNTAKDVEAIIAQSSKSSGGVFATIISVATLLFGATGVFYQLQQILNKMWEVKPVPQQAFLKLIKDRVFSFGLILVIAFLLLISLALSAGLSGLSNWVSRHLSESLLFVFGILDVAFSLSVITLLFAALFKFLPDAKIHWKDVWIGAFLTGILFTIAKFALGLYFGKSDPASAYGAAGTIILIMLWVSYSGLILLFGAEFTRVYANRFGKKVVPSKGAVSTEHEEKQPAPAKEKEGISQAKAPTTQPVSTYALAEEPSSLAVILNRLLTVQLDRAQGYEEALKEAKEPAMQTLFHAAAKSAHAFAADLRARLHEMGGQAQDHTSTAGNLFRDWMTIQAKMTGNNSKFILNTCEEGENVALKAYEQVVNSHSFSEEINQMIWKHTAHLIETKEAVLLLQEKVDS